MAKKITKLTDEQKARLDSAVVEWLTIGRSTAPLDRPKAADAISAMYQAIGKERPAVLFFSSPLMCILAWNVLRSMAKDGSQLRSQLRSQLGSQLGSQLRSQLGSQRIEWPSSFAGSWWSAWEVFYDYCHHIGVMYTPEQERLLGLWIEQSRHCHWWFPFDGIVFASERPTRLTVDVMGRLHDLNGAALAYSDGYSLYSVRGTRVPDWIIERPNEITPQKIDSETNAEVRRVMIERFGQARYVTESGSQVVHELPDNYFLKGLRTARLLVKAVSDDEPIVMLDMLNSTPEPDGSTKRYMLRIDPNAYDGEASRDCTAAMASTWRNQDGSLVFKKPADYRPMFES